MLSFVNKLSLFGIAMATILAAQESICPTPCDPCHPCEPCKPCETPCVDERTPYDQGYPVQGARITECVLKPGYNAPARIDVKCKWDFFLTGTFLYLDAREEGTDPGFMEGITVGNDYSARNVPGSTIEMSHEYKPGFQVGAGWHSNKDDWSIRLDYTRYHAEHTKRADAAANMAITPLWFHSSDSTRGTFIEGKWDLKMDFLDLSLCRAYYVGKNLTFKPHIAFRGGWIDQTYDSFINIFNRTETFESNSKSDSWFVGPRVGLDTSWLLGSGFRLAGYAAVSILYQDFETHTKAQKLDDPRYFYFNIEQDEFVTLNPIVDLMLGLGWGSYFCDNKYHFDLFAGYDFSVMFDQNKMRSLKDTERHHVDGPSGNLFLNGLVVTATFDF